MMVRAKSLGYTNDRRYREGEIFNLDERFIKTGPGGEKILPLWVEALSPAKAEAMKPKRGKKVEELNLPITRPEPDFSSDDEVI